MHHLVRPAGLLACLEDALVGLGQEVAGFGIDEKELFLDPERDAESVPGVGGVHGPLAALGRAVL